MTFDLYDIVIKPRRNSARWRGGLVKLDKPIYRSQHCRMLAAGSRLWNGDERRPACRHWWL